MKSLKRRSARIGNYLLLSVVTVTVSLPAYAQLTEVEGTATWVLDIFSPVLLLTALTILLIGCGLAWFFGRMSGGLFVRILIGSIFVFGARTIAPKLIQVIA